MTAEDIRTALPEVCKDAGSAGLLLQSISQAEGLDDAEKAALYYELGREAWKSGLKAVAISAYEHSTAIDPQGPAAPALEMARNVMDFYHRDLYNP